MTRSTFLHLHVRFFDVLHEKFLRLVLLPASLPFALQPVVVVQIALRLLVHPRERHAGCAEERVVVEDDGLILRQDYLVRSARTSDVCRRNF